MKLRQQFFTAITGSVCAGIFMISDKYIESLYFRIYVVFFACIPFYFWIKYFKNYIDHKIDSSVISPPKHQSERGEA